MNGPIDFSETESRLLGLKFGRYNTSSIDTNILTTGIEEGKYDVVRVKTNATDEFASKKLHLTGHPFYFNGGVRRYKVNCFEAPLPPFTHEEINFELYTGQKKEILFEVLNDSWGDNPIGYYKTPGLDRLITKEMESLCLFEYYSHFNNNRLFPNSYLWFMKMGEEIVGFIALYKYDDMVDSTIAGIYKKHQSRGLFPNILRHIRQFCRNNGLTYFCCGARNENLYSQWAFERDYMKGDGVEYIFHVLPGQGNF